MNLDEFIEDVKKVAGLYSLKVEVLARTKNAVKVRIPVTENTYIQLYYNRESGTKNYVLIGWNRRLFGRDCVGGEWTSIRSKIPTNTILGRMVARKFQFRSSSKRFLNG
ncbi:hypothetical protein [Archaeoglobus neptunius]|uniref:hypothetical protein n=1 Tax=Archaeoglobus neptunius TaxID=2798580 RepID=UPI001927C762|nr:hypothetical protein [Archaeoglobus neptunius]